MELEPQTRREALRLGVFTLAASVPLLSCGSTTAGAVLESGADIKASICALYHDIRRIYPELRAWAGAHRELFDAKVWEALVDMDRRSHEIANILEVACNPAAQDNDTQKWVAATETVIRVAQVGLKVGQFAVAAGVI